MPERCMRAHREEKARDTTLDDLKQNLLRHIKERYIDRTCVVVTALCNQPEAFASDLGDDYCSHVTC